MQRLGDLEIRAVPDGRFRLDGGAMFGIVPKPVWEKALPADDRNRVTLSLTTLLVRTPRATLLVDTGMGDRRDAKFTDLYGIERPRPLPAALAALGVAPGDVDFVILSHLHFDHAGGATRLEGGRLVPTFPHARHVIQKGMWEEALDPNPRTRGSYLHDDFVPLREAGLVDEVDGDAEITPGVRVSRTGGHVRNHQIVTVEGGGRKAAYWADLLPTAAHVKPAWVMGYDLYPQEVAATKIRLVGQAADEDWINVFEHDPGIAMARFVKDGKGVRVEAIERHEGHG